MLRPPMACRVTFDGQSQVNQPDWYGESVGARFIGWNWPRLTMADFGLPGYVQPAVGGTSLTTLASTFGTRAGPWIAPASFEPTIYVLHGGFQDYLDGDTGAQVYADCGTLAAAARARGAVYVIGSTTLPSTAFSAAQETARQAGNALILADGSGHFDDTINFEVDGLDDPTDRAAYLSDGVHIYGYRDRPTHGTGRAAAAAIPVVTAAIAAVT